MLVADVVEIVPSIIKWLISLLLLPVIVLAVPFITSVEVSQVHVPWSLLSKLPAQVIVPVPHFTSPAPSNVMSPPPVTLTALSLKSSKAV